MKRDRMFLGGVACLLAVGVALAQDSGPRGAPKIGVVDMGILISKHPDMKGAERELGEARKQVRDEVNTMDNGLREKQMDLEESGLAKDSLEYKEKAKALTLQARSMKRKIGILEAALSKKVHAATAKILKKVHQSVAKYAQKQRYTFILKTDKSHKAESEFEFVRNAQMADVIYFDQAVDCTQVVLRQIQAAAEQE